MARITELHKKWMKEPKYRKAYEALEEEFVLASAVIDIRRSAQHSSSSPGLKAARSRTRPARAF